MDIAMSVSSLDILNLSHALKDVCEVNCNTSECLSETLKVLLQGNLITANVLYSKQLANENPCPVSKVTEYPVAHFLEHDKDIKKPSNSSGCD